MRAKNVAFKRNIEPKKSLGIGLTTKDLLSNVVKRLKEVYGIDCYYLIKSKIWGDIHFSINAYASSFPLDKNGVTVTLNNNLEKTEWEIWSDEEDRSFSLNTEDEDELIKELVKFQYDSEIDKFRKIVELFDES